MSNEQVQAALLRIILLCLAGMLALALLSFWVTPTYVPGVQVAFETFKEILLVSLGVKGGMAVPGSSKQ
jgi:hypothetical protein